MVEMSREEFEDAVRDGLDLIPDDLTALIDDVVILVEDQTPPGRPNLLGLYTGVARTRRGNDWGVGQVPDRIIIYRSSIQRLSRTVEEVRKRVAKTVVHEVGHHFGINDARLRELGY
ncbi:metallopeptidase family protein [Demequina oxidasica]|uniref:metallopeptidase family protein n=1 Tax=Demequina oxidasica TaxID=676199 RepID=UPI0007830447|nr:metallopeptidase family protein [Demequina oxidasica]